MVVEMFQYHLFLYRFRYQLVSSKYCKDGASFEGFYCLFFQIFFSVVDLSAPRMHFLSLRRPAEAKEHTVGTIWSLLFNLGWIQLQLRFWLAFFFSLATSAVAHGYCGFRNICTMPNSWIIENGGPKIHLQGCNIVSRRLSGSYFLGTLKKTKHVFPPTYLPVLALDITPVLVAEMPAMESFPRKSGGCILMPKPICMWCFGVHILVAMQCIKLAASCREPLI